MLPATEPTRRVSLRPWSAVSDSPATTQLPEVRCISLRPRAVGTRASVGDTETKSTEKGTERVLEMIIGCFNWERITLAWEQRGCYPADFSASLQVDCLITAGFSECRLPRLSMKPSPLHCAHTSCSGVNFAFPRHAH